MKKTFKQWRFTLPIILISVFLGSCVEEPNPFSAPIFEINNVSLINNQVFANVDISQSGSEQINEVGLIITKNQDPVFAVNYGETAFFIPANKKGEYQIPLELKNAGYYFIRSIIKTQKSSWYYSQPYDFIFDGSNVTTNKEIILPIEPIYFGDLITISNKELGIPTSNYYVEVNGIQAEIINASNDSFQFKISENINFNYEPLKIFSDSDNEYVDFISISYLTSNGMVNKVKMVSLKRPVFLAFQNIEKDLDPGLNWIIEGEFLSDKFLEVRVKDSEIPLKIVSITESRIEVEPGEGINFENPTLEITCRGRKYGVNFPPILEEEDIECDSCPVGG